MALTINRQKYLIQVPFVAWPRAPVSQLAASCLRRDSLVSVVYAEELHSTTSSVTPRSTDRQEIVDQKLADFQESL
jgi:hypothetical protein